MCRLAQLRLTAVVAALAAGALLLSWLPGGAARAAAALPPTCAPYTAFSASAFPAVPAIDNPLFPLTPGTRFVLDGQSAVTGAPLPHRITFTVSDMTKQIGGVTALVGWDVDVSDGEVTESELAFFAQDASGNVWTMGEYPEEYANGTFTGAPATWFHGLNQATAGVLVPGHPATTDPEWLQGSSPPINFLDCALTKQLGQQTCVPVGCFNDVTVIDERSPLDPASGTQEKFYAPGVGNVRITAIGDPENETLVLSERRALSSGELINTRQEIQQLEQHGRQVSTIYAATAPLQQLPAPPPPVEPPPVTPPPPEPTPPPTVTEASPPPPPPTKGGTLDPAAYVAKVDNPFFPASLLKLTVAEGVQRDENTHRKVRARVVRRLLSRTTMVGSVPAVTVDVREYANGHLVEHSRDLFAQDREGSVWYLGEDVDEVRRGRVVGHEGQWRAGSHGAEPGLLMPASPVLGQAFDQENAPGTADARSTVLRRVSRLRTHAGRFSGCLLVRDVSRLEQTTENKYYCRGAGVVLETAGPDRVELVRRVAAAG